MRTTASSCRWHRRTLCTVALLAQAGAGQAGDLLSHNGFDACWSQALDRTEFASLLAASVEGQPACIAAVIGSGSVDYCMNSTCGGNVPGCPVTLRAGAATPVGGTQDTFSAYSRLDSFSMPMIIPFAGECTANFDTARVTLDYRVAYDMRADGNNGLYVDSLAYVSGVTVNGLDTSDVSLTGGFNCQLANLGLGLFLGTLSDIAPSLEPVLQPTVGESICPAQ